MVNSRLNNYKIYKVAIEPKSSTITPYQSDTLFGHICWYLLRKEGEQSLIEFLTDVQTNKSFLISSAMPYGYLPRPVLPPKPVENQPMELSSQNLKQYAEEKELKKEAYIKEEFFNKYINEQLTERKVIEFLIQNQSKKDEYRNAYQATQVLVKNTISRKTFTTLEGRLFTHKEIFLGKLQVFLKISDSSLLNIDQAKSALEVIGKLGFGKRATTGKGAFVVSEVKEVILPEANNPNAFLTLSNYVPFNDDPRNGWGSILVKWGKLGGEFALEGQPFKKPILMYLPGSVFIANGKIEPAYGGLLPKIALKTSGAYQKAVQCALAFPLGVIV